MLSIMLRQKQSGVTGKSTYGMEYNSKFDKAQLNADNLPQSNPGDIVGSDVVPPMEMPSYEKVSAEVAA
jgi:hypothetical protein